MTRIQQTTPSGAPDRFRSSARPRPARSVVLIDAADICSALVARLRPPASRLEDVFDLESLRCTLGGLVGARAFKYLVAAPQRPDLEATREMALRGGWEWTDVQSNGDARLDGIDRYIALRALSLFSQLGMRGPDGLLILRHRTRATLALSTLARGGGWLGFAGFPDIFDDSVRRLHRNGLCELYDAGDLMPFEADR